MKIKAFSFNVDTSDPRPIRLSVETNVFSAKEGSLEELSLRERGFSEEDDLLDFDMEFGDTFNIAYNDLIHGEFSVKVREGTGTGRLLKVYVYRDELRGKSGVLFRVLDENGVCVYVDNMYFSEPLEKRIGRVSRLLGVSLDELKRRLGLS